VLVLCNVCLCCVMCACIVQCVLVLCNVCLYCVMCACIDSFEILNTLETICQQSCSSQKKKKHTHTHTQNLFLKCLLSFGAESVVFQVAIQKLKDQDI